MKALIATIIGATIGTAAAHATHPVVIRQSYQYQVPAAYYVPVTVPQYSVGSNQQIDLTPLIEELKLLRLTVQQLKAGGDLGGELPPEPEYVGLVRQNCAKCHGTNPQGNKLSFFDSTGRLKEPTPEVLGSIIAQVSSGAMPKGGTMAPADRLKLIAGFTTSEPTKGKTP
jgi:mono/diheme cytochrome c family protein